MKASGRHEAVHRVAPAHERLDRADPAGDSRHEGLVEQEELVGLEAASKICLGEASSRRRAAGGSAPAMTVGLPTVQRRAAASAARTRE
jgi:hypothetical protein